MYDDFAPLSQVQRANCAILADLLESLPDNKVRMNRWAATRNECGTVGCALGWAAMSGQFPGLEWGVCRWGDFSDSPEWATTLKQAEEFLKDDEGEAVPIVFGGKSDWQSAGEEYFGEKTLCKVFLKSKSRKPTVIKRLRNLAERG